MFRLKRFTFAGRSLAGTRARFICSLLSGTAALVTSTPVTALVSDQMTSLALVELKEETTGIRFVHRTGAVGTKELMEPFGSGCGLFDYDNDGDLDVLFINGANIPSMQKTGPEFYNRFYRNEGGFRFTEMTEQAGLKGIGYGMGCAAGDYDNDGFVDLYLTTFDGNQLLRNDGHGRFTDVTSRAGVAGGKWSTSAAFFDFNKDGFLDLYVCRYLVWEVGKGPFCGSRNVGLKSYCLPDNFPPIKDLLFRNNGDGTFTDVSTQSGIDSVEGKGLGVVTGDIDLDGWSDIFVANDRHRNFLWRNKGDGTFEEIGSMAGVAYSPNGTRRAGMGTDIADFNEDGWPDVMVTNFSDEGIGIFRSYESAYFEDEAATLGVMIPSLPYVIFGARFCDLDNDGWLDLFAVTGHILDNINLYRSDRTYEGPKLLFHNTGSEFQIVRDRTGALSRMCVGRGAAFGDIDNDGDVDIIVNNSNSGPSILRNDTNSSNRSLLLSLKGSKSNRDGVGTLVEVKTGTRKQKQEAKSSGSYCAANDPRIHVGLGANEQAEKVTLTWPSGKKQVFDRLKAGFVYEISEEEGLLRGVPLNLRPKN